MTEVSKPAPLLGDEKARKARVSNATAGTFGDTDQEALRTTALQGAQGLSFDANKVEQSRLSAFDADLEQERLRLARQFGSDQSRGGFSGAAQNRFEVLGAQAASQRHQIRADTQLQAAEQNRANLQAQSGVLGADVQNRATQAASQRAETQQQLDDDFRRNQLAQQQRQFTTTQTGKTADNQQTLAAKQQTLDENFRQSQLQQQQQQFLTQQTGVVGGGQPASAESLGVDISGGSAAVGTLQAKFEQVFGRAPTATEIDTLLAGGTLTDVRGADTLSAKQQLFQQEQQALNSALDRALKQADATGEFRDPITGQTGETLQAELQRGQLQLEQDIRDRQTVVAESAQALAENIQNGQLALQRQEVVNQQRLAEADRTGILSQQVGMIALGLDPATAASLFGPNGGVLADQFENYDIVANEIASAFQDQMGRTPDPDELLSIIQGGEVVVHQGLTLAARQQQAQISIADRQTAVSEGQLGLQQTAETNRNQLATDTLALQSDIQRGQLALQQVQEANQVRLQEAQLTGRIASGISAANLGINPSLVAAVNGPPSPERDAAFFEIHDTLVPLFHARAGRQPTPEEINALLSGEQVLFSAQETLQARQIQDQQRLAEGQLTGDLWVTDPATGEQASVKTLSAQQALIDQTLAIAQQSGELTVVHPVTGQQVTTDTLAQQQQALQTEIQQGQLQIQQDAQDLAEQQAADQTRLAEAGLTGQFTQTFSLLDMGITDEMREGLYNPDGTVNFDEFFALADVLAPTFEAAAGRPPTQAELYGLLTGGQIEIGTQETLAEKQRQLTETNAALERAIAQGNATGEFIDPVTELPQETLQAQQQAFNQSIAQQQTALQAAETFGGTDSQTAQSLGITLPSMNLRQMAETQPDVFADLISDVESAFAAQTGRAPTDDEIETILNGGTVTGQQTLAAQQLAQQNQQFLDTQQLAREQATGLIDFGLGQDPEASLDRMRFTETQHQFDENLSFEMEKWMDQYGLNEEQAQATIKQIEHQMAQQTRELSAQIGQNWAQITGRAGTGVEPMSALDFGVNMDNADPHDTSSPEAMALMSSFESMVGRPPSEAELSGLMNGNTVDIEGAPTMEARRFAAEVSNQAMERMNQYAAIAADNGLERDKFEYAKDEADRQWAATNLEVAQEFGLPDDAFRMAKFLMDAQLDAIDPLAEGAADQRQQIILDASEAFAESHGVNSGAFLQANDRFDQVYGNQLREIGRQQGFQDAQWETAQAQAELAEQQQMEIWGSLLAARGGEHPDDFTSDEFLNLFGGGDENAAQTEVARMSNPIMNSKTSYADSLGTTNISEIAQAMATDRDPGLMEAIGIFESVNDRRIQPSDYAQFAAQIINGFESGGVNEIINTGLAIRTYQPDWVANMDGDKLERVFAFLNGGNITPERQNVNSWATLGAAVGRSAVAIGANKIAPGSGPAVAAALGD